MNLVIKPILSMLHVVQLSIENKMNDAKKIYDSLSIVGSIAAAVSLPWILFKICKSIYVHAGYKNLKDQVSFAFIIHFAIFNICY